MSYLAITTHKYSYHQCPSCNLKKLNFLKNQLLSCGNCGYLFHFCKGRNNIPIIGDISPENCVACKNENMKMIVYKEQNTLTAIDYLVFSLKLSKGIITKSYSLTKNLFNYIYDLNIWSEINNSLYETVDVHDYLLMNR